MKSKANSVLFAHNCEIKNIINLENKNEIYQDRNSHSLFITNNSFTQATTPAPEGAKPTVFKKYSFKKIDFNGDKQISKEEAKKAGISEAEFNLIDKDRSGFITWNEAVNSPSKNWTE